MNPENKKNITDEKIHTFYGSDGKIFGFLIIHSLINGKCCGGIRMALNLSIEELLDLAYYMTLKFAYLGINLGGAKGGIIGDPEMDAFKKEILFRKYGEAISPFLKKEIYIPGVDLGIKVKDIENIVNASGLTAIPDIHFAERSGEATAFTTFVSMQEACKFTSLSLSSVKIGIEGFGSVGSSLAKLLLNTGAKIIAVSNHLGSIKNPDGLDTYKLLSLYEKVGHNCIVEYRDAEFSVSTILTDLPLDVYAPCGRLYSIDENNIKDIKCKIICGGSNLQAVINVENTIHENSILYVPPFIANCGGVLFGSMQKMNLNYEYFQDIVNSQFRLSVRHLFEKSKIENLPPIIIANREIEKRVRLLKSVIEQNKLRNTIWKFGRFLNHKGFIPNFLKRFIGRRKAMNLLIKW